MNIKKLFVSAACFSLFTIANQTHALTVQQFKEACSLNAISCEENQIINAYIGGALDLVASLQDETEYLTTIYCKKPEQLFDIKKITLFIKNSDSKYDKKNAMLLFVAYFEEHGGC